MTESVAECLPGQFPWSLLLGANCVMDGKAAVSGTAKSRSCLCIPGPLLCAVVLFSACRVVSRFVYALCSLCMAGLLSVSVLLNNASTLRMQENGPVARQPAAAASSKALFTGVPRVTKLLRAVGVCVN